MFTTNQSPSGGYSNINAATSSEGKIRKHIIRNHNNGSRRENQPGNRSLASFRGEVSSVVAVFGTVSEQHSTKYQFKIFQDKVKNMYHASLIIQGTLSSPSRIPRIHMHTLTWTIPSSSLNRTNKTSYLLHNYRRR